MNYYPIVKFIHIVGALGYFAALGLEWMSLRQLRRATTVEQVREWIRLPVEMRRVGMISMVILLATGIFMMMTVLHGIAWIFVALGSLVPMPVLAMAVSRPRMAAIERSVTAEHRTISPALRKLLHHPLLWIEIQTRVAIALGIVFLMSVKPDLIVSLLTIGVAIIIGLASSLPLRDRERTQEKLSA